jgi:peptide/nickel transport system substrate-binding protein
MIKHLHAGLAIALAITLAGCGSGNNQSSKSGLASSAQYPELRIGMPEFPGGINWTTNPWGPAVSIESLAVQGLVEVTPDDHFRPLLARSIEHPNSTTYIYNIRPGIRFSDGKPLTAADAAYSLQQNLSAKEAQWKPYYEEVASIATRGDSVVVRLRKPDALWPVVLAASDQVVEKSQIAKVGEQTLGTPHALPIGTGPWMLNSFTPEVGVQLSRNRYWRGARQPARSISITFFKTESAMALAMRSGGIDGVPYFESQHLFASIPSTHIETGPESAEDFLAMNTATPPLSDVHVRRAIAYAINAGGIVKALFAGNGAKRGGPTIVPPPGFGDFPASQVSAMLASLPKYDFDLDAAKRELAKSAYPHGFTTEVEAASSEQLLVTAAQIVSADLAKIGITAKVHEITPGEVAGLFGRKVKLFLNETGTEFADPNGTLPSLVSPVFIRPPGNGINVAQYRNAEVTKLLAEEEGEEASQTRRLQMIGRILKIVGAEVPYVQLVTHSIFLSLSDKYVTSGWSLFAALYTPWAMNIKLAR